MPLKLIAPRQRKNNPFWLVRGTIGGREIEVSTETRNEAEANIFKARLELSILEDAVPGAGEAVTFRRAAALYAAFISPPKSDQRRIDAIVIVLGDRTVADIGQADLVDAAHRIYPGRKNETKNRAVIKPAAAILHYAARNRWCEWLRIEKLQEAPPVTRPSDDATMRIILTALSKEEAEAKTPLRRDRAARKRLLILWLFRHWNRISDPLRLTWPDIDMERRTYTMLVSKAKKYREKPIDDDVLVALANIESKSGRLFPWHSRASVYKWLTPLCRRLKVTFTPHMARHYGGTQLNRAGVPLKTIMGALDHSDASSSLRYQAVDMDTVREAMSRMPKINSKSGSRSGDGN